MKTPIVLITFNRPQLTRQVFDIIRREKPSRLFLISDGPRTEKGTGEAESVAQTRRLISKIDWPCKVFKKFEEQNLGCRKSVSTGLNWVFSQVNQAIILEDDCVPNLGFFKFCEELLDKYHKIENIMMISGDNFLRNEMHTSYGFCRHSLIWGWATWKRAWDNYQSAQKTSPADFEKKASSYEKMLSPYRLSAIKKTLQGKIDTWDYIWQYAMLQNDGLCIYPSVNLVKNIGFGYQATHTKFVTSNANRLTGSIVFPLKHPNKISVDISYDEFLSKQQHPLRIWIDILKRLFQ